MIDLKVACIGNMNNNMFNLVRYLRDFGVDAHLLLLDNETGHFLPENDCYNDSFREYTRELNWGDVYNLKHRESQDIRKSLEGYDFYIGCGTVPAYFEKAGINLDMMVPYGSDLYALPFYRLVHPKRMRQYFSFSRYQKKGLKRTKNILIDSANELFEGALKKVGFENNRINSGIPMIYEPEYSIDNMPNDKELFRFSEKLKEIRNNNKLVIFHHSRHVWVTKDDELAIKNNDNLIRGLAKAVHEDGLKDIHLVTLEYGVDVEHSKRLIRELDLSDNITWLPTMSRKEIMRYISYADIVAGEFNHSWFSYGVVYEAMVMGKAIMHYRKDDLYVDEYPDPYPMLHAKTFEQIAQQLQFGYDNKNELEDIGLSANAWFREHVVKKSIVLIVNSMNEKSGVS
ncbi:hypothetical protein JL49_20770 [Pseudoalteromonas luteoviolacea]|nr:hypothetical protein JL49_20770 [Pseudoalteromonas luteoviolacea]